MIFEKSQSIIRMIINYDRFKSHWKSLLLNDYCMIRTNTIQYNGRHWNYSAPASTNSMIHAPILSQQLMLIMIGGRNTCHIIKSSASNTILALHFSLITLLRPNIPFWQEAWLILKACVSNFGENLLFFSKFSYFRRLKDEHFEQVWVIN